MRGAKNKQSGKLNMYLIKSGNKQNSHTLKMTQRG